MGTESRLMLDNDVQQGLQEVGAQVTSGRPGLFIGRSSVGFVVIAGAASGSTAVGHGHMVAVGPNEAGLRALRSRIDSLLGDSTERLPEGLIVQ